MSKFKLLSLFIFLACLSLTAQAKPMICPFTDHFFLRVPEGNKIISHSVEGSLSYTQQTDIEFILQCGDGGNLESGEVTIDVGDGSNTCSVSIEDGPSYWNPVINVLNCSDPTKLRYVNTEHRIGTYEYTMVFE